MMPIRVDQKCIIHAFILLIYSDAGNSCQAKVYHPHICIYCFISILKSQGLYLLSVNKESDQAGLYLAVR